MAPQARVQKRLYYKIGEACKALGIQPYVLRYWETEFPALSPSKSRSGQRVYSEKELEVIRRIKQLLYDEGYTIAGAKKKLEGELAAGTLGDPAAPPAPAPPPHSPPPPPAVFQAPAAGRVRGPAAESERAGGGPVAGAAAGGPATNAVPGTARTVPLPLVPWAPVVDTPEAYKPEAAAASPEPASLAAPAVPARPDGPEGVPATTAADRATLPLTPPWPPLQAVPAPAAASPQGSPAKAASP